MLAIRMQRTGRKGHAQFRVVVQDSRKSPKSGKLVALVGNYDPHTKTSNLAKDKIELYLKNGAQPSDRTALLFKKEGIKLPTWVSVDTKKQAKARHPDKLNKDQPKAEPKAEEAKAEDGVEPEASTQPTEPEATPVETEASTETKEDAPAESNQTAASEEAATEATENVPEESAPGAKAAPETTEKPAAKTVK